MGTARQTSRTRPKIERLEARISCEQKKLFQRAADLQGRSLTDFVVGSAQEAAVRTVQEMEIIHLSLRDSQIFAEALLKPQAPNAALRRAFRRHKDLIGR